MLLLAMTLRHETSIERDGLLYSASARYSGFPGAMDAHIGDRMLD